MNPYLAWSSLVRGVGSGRKEAYTISATSTYTKYTNYRQLVAEDLEDSGQVVEDGRSRLDFECIYIHI